MTDNLRTRIAAVICDMDALHAQQWSLDVADAVIAALGLEVTVTAESNDGRFRACSIEGRIAAVSDRHTAMGFDSDYGPNDQWVCHCGVTWTAGGTHGEHLADAVIRELPEPIKPTPPELEDLTSIPAQKHVWSRRWDADIHQGYFCTECEEMSDCELCNKDWDAGDDCLVVQADDRNRKAMRLFKKVLERWEAQMDYWREMTGAADD